MRIHRWALVVAVLAVASSSLFAATTGSFQRSLPVNGPVDLQVQTRSGDITVHTGPAGTVAISAKIRASNSFLGLNTAGEKEVREIEQNPPVHQTGNMIKVDYPPYSGVSIDYDITVPPDTTLRADTGSGNQNVRGLHGRTDLHTGSGDVQINDINGAVRVDTGSGNVQGAGLAGSFDSRTGSGDMRLTFNGTGDFRVRTGSGDVQLRGVNGSLTLDTGSGDVVIDGQQKAPWSIRTGSGDVRLRLPRDASFDVDASAGTGNVSISRPVATTVQGKTGQTSHHRIAGKIGNGGPLLRVQTGSGDVTID